MRDDLEEKIKYYNARVRLCMKEGGRGTLECERCDLRETCRTWKEVIKPETEQWRRWFLSEENVRGYAGMFDRKFEDDTFRLTPSHVSQRIDYFFGGIRIRGSASETVDEIEDKPTDL